MRDFIVRKKKIKENSEKILKMVHVDARPGSPCSILEDNEKQRLEIAKVLADVYKRQVVNKSKDGWNRASFFCFFLSSILPM